MTREESNVCKAFLLSHTKYYRGEHHDHRYHTLSEIVEGKGWYNPQADIKLCVGDMIRFFDAMTEEKCRD
jgi:hypothetical protein